MPRYPTATPFLPVVHDYKHLKSAALSCRGCDLFQQATQTVFGEGDPDAQIFFIGEGPGEKEDLSGRPFVGPAGHKLDEMIGAMGLTRSQVYIANIVKCHPMTDPSDPEKRGNDRAPLPSDSTAQLGSWPPAGPACHSGR